MAPQDSITRTADLIKSGKARKIAVLTGAGISTSAGIPDFRSPGTGLYDNLAALNLPFPEAVFTLDYFEERPEPFWTLARDLYPGKYYPTPTHYFLTLLHRKGLLQRVWSQNIDTLETAAGVPPDLVLEAHGSFATAHCLRCKRHASIEHVVRSGVRDGRVVRCMHERCEGLVKPDIVFFGEGLPNEFFSTKRELMTADLLLILGTSLAVHPFAGLIDVVNPSTPRVLINREAVGPFARRRRWFGDSAPRKTDMAFLGDADEAVRLLAEELGWADELERMVAEGRAELREKWRRQEEMWAPRSEAAERESEREEKREVEKKAEVVEKEAQAEEDEEPAAEDDAAVDALADAVAGVEIEPSAGASAKLEAKSEAEPEAKPESATDKAKAKV